MILNAILTSKTLKRIIRSYYILKRTKIIENDTPSFPKFHNLNLLFYSNSNPLN